MKQDNKNVTNHGSNSGDFWIMAEVKVTFATASSTGPGWVSEWGQVPHGDYKYVFGVTTKLFGKSHKIGQEKCKETTVTMDPSPKTIEPCANKMQWN